MDASFTVRGVRVPGIFYGTAWKEERTEELTRTAISVGFRGIDTANQRKHYHEAGVGAALAVCHVAREDLFIQTKFTFRHGQDHRLPYDPQAEITRQVVQSFARSCHHLGVERIDSYLLHGPMHRNGWSEQDREAWRAMESLHQQGLVGLIGVSNVGYEQLETLCSEAVVAPAFVQNRCYARTGWDHDVRALCKREGIVYQGFSLLTANTRELASPRIAAIARRVGGTLPQIVFRFAHAVGMLPLTGTTDRRHMEQDLLAAQLELTADEVTTIENIVNLGSN